VPAAVALAAATFALPRWGEIPTSYAAISTPARVADLAAGLSLLFAGLVAWLDDRARRLGLLAMLAGAAWFAPDWEGWDHGPPLVRSLGAALSPLFLVLIFHLVVAAPRGRIDTRATRVFLFALYGVALTVMVGRTFVRDPLFDLHCWRNCLENVFLVHADPGIADALDGLWLRSAIAVGGLTIVVAAWRLGSATAPARRALVPIVVPGAAVAAAEGTYALALLRDPFEDPTKSSFEAIFFVRAAALALLALGVLWTVARARRLRSAVARLAAELGEVPPPGSLRSALAAAVGDPTLEVAYRLPGSSSYVGADGKRVVTPVAGNGRAVTAITRNGRQLAVVVHDAGLLEGPGLENEIGAAARLAVENERLRAEVLAQLEELRASRARIVEQGDTERRRLERDLHDGAQQRLLALSYDIRLARTAVASDGEYETGHLLSSAEKEAHIALIELRKLAHGIFPAILAEAGLGPALASLADEAPLPVELGDVTSARYASGIETAAYVTVADAIDDAGRRSATFVAVEVAPTAERLVVTARDDGTPRVTTLTQLVDRIGALGGTVDVGPTVLRAEIPCA
jgi:signal transduction histidine kinase